MGRVYCVTPFVLGESLGLGAFDSQEAAYEAMVALERHVGEDHGLSVEWHVDGWLDEEVAEDYAIYDLLGISRPNGPQR